VRFNNINVSPHEDGNFAETCNSKLIVKYIICRIIYLLMPIDLLMVTNISFLHSR